MHFIARNMIEDYGTVYLYHRRNNGSQYESRSIWGEDIGQARVFTTAAAATNSARQSGEKDFEVVMVRLSPLPVPFSSN